MFLIMLQSSKSGFVSSWCRQIWDVCDNMFFMCWSSASYWNSIELVSENSKWDAPFPPPLSVWIGLNCIFSLLDISGVDFKGEKTEKWLGIPSNWLLKIQNGILPPFWVWIGLNCSFSLWDTSEIDFKGEKTEKWLQRSAIWPSTCKKLITTPISNLAAPATDSSTLTKLKHDEKHT